MKVGFPFITFETGSGKILEALLFSRPLSLIEFS